MLLAGATTLYVASREGGPGPSSTKPAGSAQATRMVVGTLSLDDNFDWEPSTGCWGARGYDDIKAGAQVVVTDSSGNTVALSHLDQGRREVPYGGLPACKFNFLVRDVPTGGGYYGVEIAHRGRVQYPEQQLFGALALTLG
ncbi:hypothetical protein AB0N38_10460 [Micromonospora aurantiaca]|uniref:NfeD family protein n=1 Tax=Micromonospora aurantiaca (nom. illeg.) TaxID=47850 RepID=UPI0034481399